MAIVIKELRIKVNVIEETDDSFHLNQKVSSVKLSEMKTAILNECITKVMEKIKEKAER
ncbi:MAG: hypothetical protein HC854_08905 [Flavobacterium sp.]|nr:hypothetical protein [Flavobacterium sp.]